MEDLTIKQKRFCDEYLKSGNATQSYKKAGYKYTADDITAINATRLLRTDKVKEYIAQRQEKIDTHAILSIQQAQELLTKIAGNLEEERTADRLKAVELLMRSQGGFLDKSEVNLFPQGNFDIEIKKD